MADELPRGRPKSRGKKRKPVDLEISIKGFKAIGDKLDMRVAPLTIISGANSSGKSSFIQPLLLMKQTLESSFDPGALLLHGPNAKFTSHEQLLSRGRARRSMVDSFEVGISFGGEGRNITFSQRRGQLQISRDVARAHGQETVLTPGMEKSEIAALEHSLSKADSAMLEQLRTQFSESSPDTKVSLTVNRRRCFLDLTYQVERAQGGGFTLPTGLLESGTDTWVDLIRGIIHVPGLRGNPERQYVRTAVGSTYPGTLDKYVASILLEWSASSPGKLEQLANELLRLGLTWKVSARKVNDAAVELLVGRMGRPQQGGANDLVSVADVGFGVSQTLPVVVALLAARQGQIVYIEQPEIHLHPRAQMMLAKTLVDAVARGVRVIAETHSSILIRAIQTEVARNAIGADNVSLNWVGRNPETGFATLSEAKLDRVGRFGDWPVDFDEISEELDSAYIDAIVEAGA